MTIVTLTEDDLSISLSPLFLFFLLFSPHVPNRQVRKDQSKGA